MDTLQQFSLRLKEHWLPTYCEDPKRNYDPVGFRETSVRVSEIDARDCMLAVDHGIVFDTGGGRYRANRNSAHEVLFWEGRRTTSPRPITLWLEPIITFAALARLHLLHDWPKEALGTQSKTWAFDLVAFEPGLNETPRILGEIKKSSAELRKLRDDLVALSNEALPESIRTNSLKKWQELLSTKAPLLWLVGPSREECLFSVTYDAGRARLNEISEGALAYSTA